MRRLVCATAGTWQITMAVSALRQEIDQTDGEVGENTLLLHDIRFNEAVRQPLIDFANALWPFKRVVFANDIIYNEEGTAYSQALEGYRKVLADAMARLRERVGGGSFDEIVHNYLFARTDRLILDTFPESRLIVYEDGLGSYAPRRMAVPVNFRPKRFRGTEEDFQIAILARELRTEGVHERHLIRTKRIYLTQASGIPAPPHLRLGPIRKLEKRYFRETLDSLREKAFFRDMKVSAGNFDNPVLVLGQSISRIPAYQVTWEEELEIHRKLIVSLQERGLSVIWKEHPRMDRPFFGALAHAVDQERFAEVRMPHWVPVEFIVDDLKPAFCAALVSTSLLYLPEFFDIPTFTLLDDDIIRRVIHIDVNIYSNCIIRGYVPPISHVLNTTPEDWDQPRQQARQLYDEFKDSCYDELTEQFLRNIAHFVLQKRDDMERYRLDVRAQYDTPKHRIVNKLTDLIKSAPGFELAWKLLLRSAGYRFPTP